MSRNVFFLRLVSGRNNGTHISMRSIRDMAKREIHRILFFFPFYSSLIWIIENENEISHLTSCSRVRKFLWSSARCKRCEFTFSFSVMHICLSWIFVFRTLVQIVNILRCMKLSFIYFESFADTIIIINRVYLLKNPILMEPFLFCSLWIFTRLEVFRQTEIYRI